MEYVKEKLFYHLHRKSMKHDMKKGELYYFGIVPNRFIIDPNGILWIESKNDTDDLKALKWYIDKHKNKKIEITRSLLNNVYDFCVSHAIDNREKIFEEIRLKLYPEYPSRYNCIFLFDNLKDSQYWIDKIGECDLFQVKISGKIHYGSEYFLQDGINLSKDELLWNALQYWNGVRHPKDHLEILGIGTVKIMKKIDQ